MGAQPSKATTTTTTAGWSDLPPELLDLVLRRLSSFADRVRFACVCRYWRRATMRYSPPNLPRVLPWINFRDGSFRSLPDGELHHLHSGKRNQRCAGSAGSWLLFERTGCKASRRDFLRDPLSKAIMRLPGHCNEPVSPNPDGSLPATCIPGSARSTDFFLDKVIVCSSDLIAAKVMYRDFAHAVVCCRPGISSSWSTGLWNGHWYEDMAFWEGKLYAVTAEGDLFVHEVTEDCDTGEPWVSRIEHLIRAPPPHTLDGSFYASLICVRKCYLVVSCTGKLLMVRWIVPDDHYCSWDSTRLMKFKVFEADVEMSRWLEVRNLGDQVLFVSSNCSKTVKASSHGDSLQGNKIYFIDDGIMFWPFWQTDSSPRTCGVYDLGSNTVHPMSLGELRISDHSKASWLFL